MYRNMLFAALLMLAMVGAAVAQDSNKAAGTDFQPPDSFKEVSTLVDLPDFLPGLGTLYVDPDTLPAGPFLAYDHDDKFVSTIYMIPLEAMNNQDNFDDLKAFGAKTVSVSMMYNAGHPGVEEPHYHVILWHVPQDEANLE